MFHLQCLPEKQCVGQSGGSHFHCFMSRKGETDQKVLVKRGIRGNDLGITVMYNSFGNITNSDP